jgi:hypothetical protein
VSPALLDWLDVPVRHAVAGGNRASTVVVDLPDFDSVERHHRLEVDRMVELVDLLVWVVDPQKYADAALHERYLRPLAAHRDVMVVVLNQADTLDGREEAACREDLRGLLAADGLGEVPLLAISARTGEGVAALSRLLDERAAQRDAALARLETDVVVTAAALAEACDGGRGGAVGRRERERLAATLAAAAGADAVARAVDRSHRRAGALSTGWPAVRWVHRLRPDPLRRLRLGPTPDEDVRTSLPGPTGVQRSQVASALRTVAEQAAGDLPAPWPALARRGATSHEEELPARLDRAVAGTTLATRRPLWWRAAWLVQMLLAGAAVIGALWLLALGALGYLQLGDVVPTPEVRDVAVPTLMLAGGLLAGLLLALIARLVNRAGGRRRARAATRALQARIDEVADELVIAPLTAELDARGRLCEALATASARGRRWPGRR